MPLFSSAPPSYLGIDLGIGGVKIVELRNNKGRAQLLTYGFAEESGEINHEDYFANTKRLSVIIKKICDKANTTSKQVIASLPTYTVFDSIITLPLMPQKKLKCAIEAEARKLISRPLEEMVLYWNILNQEDASGQAISYAQNLSNNNDSKKQTLVKNEEEKDLIISKETKYLKILLTAAPKIFINKYIKIFHEAELKLLSLETAAFALTRSLAGMDKSQLLIADVGAETTEVIILNQGLPVFSRSINLGGIQVTKAIQKNLKISYSEAEQIKLDLSANKSEQPAEIIKILEEIITPIINEIKYSINLYLHRLSLQNKEQENEKNIEKIILTGGNSLLAGLNEYITKELTTRVFIGDPWARVIYPQDLKPLLDEIGPKFSISIGLAMREIN